MTPRKDDKMLYIWIILAANIAIVAANILYLGVCEAIVTPPIGTLTVFLVDSVVALLIRRALPNRWFSHESALAKVSKKETLLYQRLGIRKWRSKIPDLGVFTGFRKDKVYEPKNSEYVKRYILEANYGAVIHFACALFGFLIIFILPARCALTVSLPVAAVNAFLHLLPAFSLRYNLPRLLSLLRMNARREKKG